MRYAVVFEKSEANFGAYVPDLPGCEALSVDVGKIRWVRTGRRLGLVTGSPPRSLQGDAGKKREMGLVGDRFASKIGLRLELLHRLFGQAEGVGARLGVTTDRLWLLICRRRGGAFRGVAFRGPILTHPFTGEKVAYFSDPDGNLLYLSEANQS